MSGILFSIFASCEPLMVQDHMVLEYMVQKHDHKSRPKSQQKKKKKKKHIKYDRRLLDLFFWSNISVFCC